MTDIVERLRNRNNPENRRVMMTEAADEIERLGALAAIVREQGFEIERLQAALLQIANLNGVSTRLDAQKVANRALEPKP